MRLSLSGAPHAATNRTCAGYWHTDSERQQNGHGFADEFRSLAIAAHCELASDEMSRAPALVGPLIAQMNSFTANGNLPYAERAENADLT
jgi:hypothetical protein